MKQSVQTQPMKRPRRNPHRHAERPDGASARQTRRDERGTDRDRGRSKDRSNDRGEERSKDRRAPRLSREVSVLYEDDAVIVLNKPAGLLAVPIKGSDVPSALSLLIAELKPKRQRALVVHRIDRFASGVLLFAKTDRDRDALIRQFLAHTPVRQYLAVVRGRLGARSGTLVHYFRRQGMFQQLRTARDPEAARAELRYSVERFFADATLVRVELVTGLQNQIRAQFSALGHPLISNRNNTRRSGRGADSPALHFMPRIFSSFIPDQERTFPSTADRLLIFSICYENWSARTARGADYLPHS